MRRKILYIITVTLLIWTHQGLCAIFYSDDQLIVTKIINSIRLERLGYRYLLSEDRRLSEYAREKLQEIVTTGNFTINPEDIEKDLKERGIQHYMATATLVRIGVVNIITPEEAFKLTMRYLSEKAYTTDPIGCPLLFPGYTNIGVSLAVSVERRSEDYVTNYTLLIVFASEINNINAPCIMGKNFPRFLKIYTKEKRRIGIINFADGTFFAEIPQKGWYTFEFTDPNTNQSLWHFKIYIAHPEVIKYP